MTFPKEKHFFFNECRHKYLHISICVSCVFLISVSQCWSLGHVQMFYSEAYESEPYSHWLTLQMGEEGATPSLSASHAMMSCISFDTHFPLRSRK